MGDGAGSVMIFSSFDRILAYSGSAYLLLVATSCLPFIRGKLLATIGLIAHSILLAFGFFLFTDRGFLPYLIFTLYSGFAAGWYWLFKRKR